MWTKWCSCVSGKRVEKSLMGYNRHNYHGPLKRITEQYTPTLATDSPVSSALRNHGLGERYDRGDR